MNCRRNIKRIMPLTLLLLLILTFIIPDMAAAEEKEEKVVRVGWYESPFNITGTGGERSGYAYEYQQMVASYTGWKYEYVSGNWSELLQMLKDGKIDLLSDVSKRTDREKDMMFSSLNMGEEKYYIYTDLSLSDITPSDIHSLNGKKIGITSDSVQVEMFTQWAEENHIEADIVPLVSFLDVKDKIREGELDCIVSSEATEKNNKDLSRIVCIGGSDIYFAVNKDRTDLMEELDDAMSKINGINPFYSDELHKKYMSSVTRADLSAEEISWLNEHGPIKIACLKNNLSFSGVNPETGEVIGAVAEYIKFANTCIENKSIEFETVLYDDINQEIEALKSGEADAIFPMNKSLYFGEENGILLSDTICKTSMAAVTTQNFFNESADNSVAVVKGNVALKCYINTNYPDWNIVEYDYPDDCEKAVREGEADCFVTSSFRVNNYHNVNSLYCVYLLKSGNMSIATRRNDTILMSVLNKTIQVMPETLMNGALTMYANPVHKTTFMDFIKDNVVTVSVMMITIFVAILSIILILLRKARKAEAFAKESEKNTLILNEELKKSHEDLQFALASAEHANAAKTTFLNNMSHDIRTPMNAIIGFTALACSHIDNKEAVQDYLGKISTSGNHLLSLINDVLDMSRIESGKMFIDEKEVHLPDVFHDLRTIAQPNVTAKQQDFFIDTQDIKTEDIITDKLRLNQVLLNIITNAIKFTPVGGTISIRILEKPCSLEGYANFEFRVKDNGIGMSDEFKEHIFEAFTRERTSTISGIQGTGLGMAITKNIVDMLGGTIEVTSKEGKGTEFVVNLQCKKAKNQVSYEVIPEIQGARALVVDDNVDTCMSVSKMLREIGMRPDWTTTGKESVVRAKEALEQADEFKAYIIDWLMPDMNGIETVRRIRSVIGNSTPIIILTAYDWTDIEAEAREAGVTAFVSKPLFMSDLRAVLTKPVHVEKTEDEMFSGFEGKKILLVEDNVFNQEVAVDLLQEKGFDVEVAEDGVIAVEKIENASPGYYALILMDVQMPNMDGYQATRQIRNMEDKEKAEIPIIAMTANAFDEDKKAAFDSGMNGFILKPIDIPALFKTLKDIM